MNRKSQVWVSAILYVLVVVLAMTLILEATVPLINNMKDKTVFSKQKELFLSLNDYFREISQEGSGSQRTIPVYIDKGIMTTEGGKLKWEMETKSKIIEPRTKIELGNLVVASNADVKAYELDANLTNGTIVLENKFLIINISRIGNLTNQTDYETSSIINSFFTKKTKETIVPAIDFTLGNESSGFGYTELVDSGNDLPFARVYAHLNNQTLELKLEAGTDFIQARII
jgi:hypothetical protein